VRGANTVTIFHGLGDAAFAMGSTLPVGGDPFSLLVADFDGDDAQDLLSTNIAQASITLLLGRGDGAFDVNGSFHAGPGARVSFAGDFDGDARQDVLTSLTYAIVLNLNQGGSPGYAWTNLGHQLAGAGGEPLLVGKGTLHAGSAGSLQLEHAAPSAPAGLLLATASAPAPFKGGVLVPGPVALVVGLVTDGQGAAVVAWEAWPAGLAGSQLHFQSAIADAGAVQGVALSNAVRADVP
jgi:hypothetical protein